MFLDTMKPRTENKKLSLGTTAVIIRAHICGKIALMVHKMTPNFFLSVKFHPQGQLIYLPG